MYKVKENETLEAAGNKTSFQATLNTTMEHGISVLCIFTQHGFFLLLLFFMFLLMPFC